nr:MAG TPA: hypothetical protein [Caudoviricetes sp.]
MESVNISMAGQGPKPKGYVDALFDSTQYDTYLPFQSLYVDGATMED